MIDDLFDIITCDAVLVVTFPDDYQTPIIGQDANELGWYRNTVQSKATVIEVINLQNINKIMVMIEEKGRKIEYQEKIVTLHGSKGTVHGFHPNDSRKNHVLAVKCPITGET
jgi:hypothetical protein